MSSLSDAGFSIVQIETKAACNMKCTFCPYTEKNDTKSNINEALVKRIIKEISLYRPKIDYLSFNQFNEPLLDKRIFGFIDYAKELGVNTQLITNGLLLNKESICDKLITAAPTEIKLSLQVIERNTIEKSRGLKFSFNNYMQSILEFATRASKEIPQTRIVIDLGCNFISPTERIIRRILGLSTGDPAVPHDVQTLARNVTDAFGGTNFFLKNKEALNNIVEHIKSSSSDYISSTGVKIFNNVFLKVKKFHYGHKIKDFYPVANFSCGTRILSVLADGKVVPCCVDYEGVLSMGNIHDQTLNEIISSDKFSSMLSSIRKKDGKKHNACAKCFGEPTKRGSFARNILNKYR